MLLIKIMQPLQKSYVINIYKNKIRTIQKINLVLNFRYIKHDYNLINFSAYIYLRKIKVMLSNLYILQIQISLTYKDRHT